MDRKSNTLRLVYLFRAMLGLLPLLWVSVTHGQNTSITSSGLNTQVSHTTGQANYEITGGTRPGNGTNLFHSFGDFSVGANHIANFRNDSGLATSNILSRVTGGNPSTIFGTIQTSGFGNANLFLMNPAGIVFGPTASLNVGGSVTFTTADYIKLADGMRFKAMPNVVADGLLSTAPVAAFGFVGSDPGAITVQGSQLTVAEGKGLSLVGGDIRIIEGALTAPSGQIALASVVGRGEASISPEGIAIAGRASRGHIEIKGGSQPDDVARLDTSGERGGAVVIRGGQLSLMRAEITTGAKGANQTGGDIVIDATHLTTLKDVNLRTGLNPSDQIAGGGGAVSLTAPSVQGSNLTIDASAAGPGGDVSIRASGDITLQNSNISSGSFLGEGDSGNITVQAAKLTLTESGIGSLSDGLHARIGNIIIDVGRLTMQGGSIVAYGIEPPVHGGDISVSAREAILIDRGFIETGNWGVTKGGSIRLSTHHLALNHLARITTGSLEAPAGDISVNVRTLNMVNGGRISSRISGFGEDASSGNINIVASHSISIAGGEAPSGVSTGNFGGRAGSIHLVAPTMRLADGAFVTSGARSTDNASILLDVSCLDILRGSRINSLGREGGIPIEINATKSIRLDNSTVMTATEDGNAAAGNVHLHAGKYILIENSSLLSADNTNPYAAGDAGHVVIQAGKSVVIRDSTVSARAAQGNGGTIVVDARNVLLKNSQFTTSVIGGPETVGGRIVMGAKHLTLRNSQVLSTATEGRGGTINIRSHVLHRDAGTVLDASSQSGTDGTVTIKTRH